MYMIFDAITSVTSINYFMVICDCETFRGRDTAAYEREHFMVNKVF